MLQLFSYVTYHIHLRFYSFHFTSLSDPSQKNPDAQDCFCDEQTRRLTADGGERSFAHVAHGLNRLRRGFLQQQKVSHAKLEPVSAASGFSTYFC
jgi:hypothetical protein